MRQRLTAGEAPRSGRIRGAAGRGFSLFEVVTVLSILTILAAMAVPRFTGADRRHRVEAAAQRIVADLHYVSRTARARSASHGISFSVSTDSYVSSARPIDNVPDQPYLVRLDQRPYGVALVAVDFDGQSNLTFDGYGRPLTSGRVVVALGGHERAVAVDAEAGGFVIE